MVKQLKTGQFPVQSPALNISNYKISCAQTSRQSVHTVPGNTIIASGNEPDETSSFRIHTRKISFFRRLCLYFQIFRYQLGIYLLGCFTPQKTAQWREKIANLRADLIHPTSLPQCIINDESFLLEGSTSFHEQSHITASSSSGYNTSDGYSKPSSAESLSETDSDSMLENSPVHPPDQTICTVHRNDSIVPKTDWNKYELRAKHFVKMHPQTATASQLLIFLRGGSEYEAERRKKHMLYDAPAFEPGLVNKESTLFGPGLYCTQSLDHAQQYSTSDYNIESPYMICEIYIKPDTPVLDFCPDRPFYNFLLSHYSVDEFYSTLMSFQGGQSNYSNAIYIWRKKLTDKKEVLAYSMTIRNPSAIKSLKIMHPTMTTKVHIPISTDEINSKVLNLKPKEIVLPPEGLKISRKIKHATVHINPGNTPAKQTVYQYEQNIEGAVQLLRHQKKEVKFYIISDEKKYRVKPPAEPGNYTDAGTKNQLPEFRTFYLQYHRPHKKHKAHRT